MTKRQPTNAHGPPRPTQPLRLDVERYRNSVDEFNLSEDQINELLQTLWNIMYAFVDLGFGVDSVQRCLPEFFEKAGQESGDLVRVRDHKKSKELNREEPQ